MITNETITIYNKYYDAVEGYDVYKRSVLKPVWFYGTLKTVVTDKGIQSAPEYIIKVPTTQAREVSGKTYIPPKDYANLPIDALANYYTFNAGDRVVRGEVPFEVKAGVKGRSIVDLEREYDDVVTVLAANYRGDTSDPFYKILGS